MRKAHLAIVVAALSFGSAVEACRVARSPEQRVADGYRSGAISAVAIVAVDRAQYTQPPSGDAHPWVASASVRKILRGSYGAETITFERGWGSAACEEEYPLPKAGDRWVEYLWRGADRNQAVWVTYPFDVAALADPYLSLFSIGTR